MCAPPDRRDGWHSLRQDQRLQQAHRKAAGRRAGELPCAHIFGCSCAYHAAAPCTTLLAADITGWQGHRGLLHVAQDAFYRNLTADEARDIASFNFDHPSVSICTGIACSCLLQA